MNLLKRALKIKYQILPLKKLSRRDIDLAEKIIVLVLLSITLFDIDNSTLGMVKKLIIYFKDSFSVDKIKLLIKIKKIIFFKYVFRPIVYY